MTCSKCGAPMRQAPGIPWWTCDSCGHRQPA